MGSQPEGKLSTKIMKAWKREGVWNYKVHGSEFQPAGIPDICGVVDGLSVWCETKMPGNKPSPIQKYRINKIRAAGGHVVVAYSVQEALEMIHHVKTSTCTLGEFDCLYTTLFDLTEIDE
jgi:hypothetical protein